MSNSSNFLLKGGELGDYIGEYSRRLLTGSLGV